VENVNTGSAFRWMIARWGDKESFGADYSHGYLIPFVSLWVIWSKREELFAVPKKVCQMGLVLIVTALAMHWLGAKMQQTRISLISLILLIWGIPLYFFGWELAKRLIFPCSYLIFCVPLNFLDALAGPLQRIATTMGHEALLGLGIECQRVGTMLRSPYFDLNVEAACSGLRSLLAMTALTAVYAYFTQETLLKKWVLFIMSIPIAVAGNIARIISIALVSITTGQKFGAGLHHDWSGYVLFTFSISLMIGVGKLLHVNYRELFASWKKTYLNRS
jgi:exosortase